MGLALRALIGFVLQHCSSDWMALVMGGEGDNQATTTTTTTTTTTKSERLEGKLVQIDRRLRRLLSETSGGGG